VGDALAASIEARMQERTAGLWRRHVRIVKLDAENKEQNSADIEAHAKRPLSPLILTTTDLCPKEVETRFVVVKRLQRDKLIEHVDQWLADRNLSWRENAAACQAKGAFTWMDVTEWCKQFERVDPAKGRRVAAAILAQLKVAGPVELGAWFDNLSAVDHNLYYIGSDPHSGDHSLVNVLSARIEGGKLSDVLGMPKLQDGAQVRLFGDGSWSGGETERRIECLYTQCDKKACALGMNSVLNVRLAYITDAAEEAIALKVEQLANDRRCTYRNVKVECPTGNKLALNSSGVQKGLAFQDEEVLRFVDPEDSQAMRAICKKIGLQVSKRRPLGTDEVASTIAFGQSLPRAMLPVLIFGGPKVTTHDNKTFQWRPLMQSKHVEKPAASDNSIHCDSCPLLPKSVLAAAPAATVPPVEDLSTPAAGG
jgi:hypothetical protein